MGRGAAYENPSCLSPSPRGGALPGPLATCWVALGQLLHLSEPWCYPEYAAGTWPGPDDPPAALGRQQVAWSPPNWFIQGACVLSLLCHLMALRPGSGI